MIAHALAHRGGPAVAHSEALGRDATEEGLRGRKGSRGIALPKKPGEQKITINISLKKVVVCPKGLPKITLHKQKKAKLKSVCLFVCYLFAAGHLFLLVFLCFLDFLFLYNNLINIKFKKKKKKKKKTLLMVFSKFLTTDFPRWKSPRLAGRGSVERCVAGDDGILGVVVRLGVWMATGEGLWFFFEREKYFSL